MSFFWELAPEFHQADIVNICLDYHKAIPMTTHTNKSWRSTLYSSDVCNLVSSDVSCWDSRDLQGCFSGRWTGERLKMLILHFMYVAFDLQRVQSSVYPQSCKNYKYWLRCIRIIHHCASCFFLHTMQPIIVILSTLVKWVDGVLIFSHMFPVLLSMTGQLIPTLSYTPLK